MRLPTRFQTRWTYAVTLALVAAVWAVIFSFVISAWYFIVLFVVGVACIAALLWPEYERSSKMLAMSATVTTMAAMMVFGVVSGFALMAQSVAGLSNDLASLAFAALLLVSMSFGALLLGSIVTLGLPYVSAIAVALLFRTDEENSSPT